MTRSGVGVGAVASVGAAEPAETRGKAANLDERRRLPRALRRNRAVATITVRITAETIIGTSKRLVAKDRMRQSRAMRRRRRQRVAGVVAAVVGEGEVRVPLIPNRNEFLVGTCGGRMSGSVAPDLVFEFLQAVLAEEVFIVDEEARRAEYAACDCVFGVRDQLTLDFGMACGGD